MLNSAGCCFREQPRRLLRDEMCYIGLDVHKKPSDWTWSRRERKEHGSAIISVLQRAAVTARDRHWCS